MYSNIFIYFQFITTIGLIIILINHLLNQRILKYFNSKVQLV